MEKVGKGMGNKSQPGKRRVAEHGLIDAPRFLLEVEVGGDRITWGSKSAA